MMADDAYRDRSGATVWWIVTTLATRGHVLAEIEYRSSDFAMGISIVRMGKMSWDVSVRINFCFLIRKVENLLARKFRGSGN